MKKIFFAFLLIAGIIFSANKASAQYGAGISYQTFYTQLSPYGQWIDYPEYGYVWAPSLGSGFSPYSTNGYWDFTDQGWTWISGYSWGWGPFHYGRWFYDDFYGWLWVPGYEWAPAWVTWRQSNDYFGWAPLGVGIDISIGYNPPARYWCFVPQRYITYHDLNRHYLNRGNNTTVINNKKVINNTYVVNNNRRLNGPARDQVERVTNRKIEPLRIRDAQTAANQNKVQKGELAVYRPRVQPVNNNDRTIAPPKFKKYEGKNPARNDNAVIGNRNNPVSSQPVPTRLDKKDNGRPWYEKPNNPQPTTSPVVKPRVIEQKNNPAAPV